MQQTQSELPRLGATVDGRILAIADGEGDFHLYECPSLRELRRLPRPPPTAGTNLRPGAGYWLKDCCFSTDAQWLAGVYGDGALRLWQLAGGQDRHLDIELGSEGRLAASPDGRTLAVIVNPGKIRWWEFERRTWRGDPIQVPARITSAVFSPDGQVLALAGPNRVIWLVEVQTGKTHKLEGHQLAVTCLAFAPDGYTLASSSIDGSARLWHVATRQELFILHEQRGAALYSVSFSPDGKVLAVAGNPHAEGARVSLWHASESYGPRTDNPPANRLNPPGRSVCAPGAMPFSLKLAPTSSWRF